MQVQAPKGGFIAMLIPAVICIFSIELHINFRDKVVDKYTDISA